jgi:hypothetical protein
VFQVGRQSALRTTNDLVDQLQETLRAERTQYAFKLAEKQRELTAALRDVAALRYQIAHRDTQDAFPRAEKANSIIAMISGPAI